MKFDTLNVMFAFALLQQKKVPREKALAASIGAGLVGGPMGLLLPVMVAGGSTSTGTSSSGSTFGGTVKVAVPEVVGQNVEKATASVLDAGLRPSTAIHYTQQVEDGQVMQQDPEAGRLVPEDSGVELTIASPPIEEELSESEKEDKILKVVEATATKVDDLLSLKSKKS